VGMICEEGIDIALELDSRDVLHCYIPALCEVTTFDQGQLVTRSNEALT
jgi:hypothetical protein